MRLQYSGVGKIADGAGGTITIQEFSLILVIKYMLLLHSDSTFLHVEREEETMWGPSFHFECTHLMFLICLPLTFLWPKFWYLVSGWLSKVVRTWTVMSLAKTWMYHSEERMGEWRVGNHLQSWSTTHLPSQPAQVFWLLLQGSSFHKDLLPNSSFLFKQWRIYHKSYPANARWSASLSKDIS